MNILITGASGLIGTALIDKLYHEDHQIIGLSRSLQLEDDRVQWIQHDFLNDPVENLSILGNINVVFHLAGQTSIYIAKNDPIADLNANVVGFLNLLEFFKKQKSKPFVVLAGTATEVGLTEELPINENVTDRPITFYDISKLSAELYLKQYIREGWLNGCTLRFANVCGRSSIGRQKDRGIIDKIYHKAILGESISIFGDGCFLRDYIFMEDVISSFLLCIKYMDKLNGGTFYIGSGNGISLKDAFLKVISFAEEKTGTKVKYDFVDIPEGASDIETRNAIIDSSLFSKLTGWSPQLDFDSGLRDTYDS